MNLTNKKIIQIYALSPFLVGFELYFFSVFSKENPLFSSIVHINIPFGYLIDYLQMISIVSGVFFSYGAISFLLLVVIPSQLIVRLTVREGLISRLIKCASILIFLTIFFYITGKYQDLLSKLRGLFIYAFGYTIFFCLVPQKITGIIKKESYIDRFIHIILSGIIGVALCISWINLLQIKMGDDIMMSLRLPYVVGFMALLYFCIPAIVTGIVKIKNNHVSSVNQTVTCGVVGFILSGLFCVLLSPFFITKGLDSDITIKVQSGIMSGVVGGLTAMLVTIVVNLVNTQPVKQPEEINHQ